MMTAQAAGASHLLIGAVHKMSTLVQQAKFNIIDVKSRKVVFDRYVTFRGDSDQAWRRADADFTTKGRVVHIGCLKELVTYETRFACWRSIGCP